MITVSRDVVQANDTVAIDAADLQTLFEALRGRGYKVIGPTVREGAIAYDELESVQDLPVGWADEQEAGTYRLVKRDDMALFGYNVGPHSWKKLLHLPVLRLWQARRRDTGFEAVPEEETIDKMAFIGVRSCELHAIGIQDRVFLEGPYVDPPYKARRQGVFVVAVNCSQAGGTCFCASMGTGPKATSGYDLALTEILDGPRHYFLAEIGTDLGADVVSEMPFRPAELEELAAAEGTLTNVAENMGRHLDTTGIKELLYANLEHPRWDEVAARCLSCANCTMVCPTCFCVTVEDVTDLTGEQAERWRKWDSCFTTDFSYIHGGSVRATPRARYRQWLTHKLASWQDQFGTLGCVGCGRCITWCPVGIDITEEAQAIRETSAAQAAKESEN
jgi:sulfhydrogenase subunit beta (sulfur reductase)